MAVDVKISDDNLLKWSDMEDWENGASAAPTEHTLSGTDATVAREGTIIKKGTYSAAVTRVGNDATLYHDIPEPDEYDGKRVTFACWVYATVASRARIAISDGVGSSESSYHSGAAGWERLTVSRNIDALNTIVRVEMQVNTGNTTAYFDGGLLVEGDNDIYVMTDNVDISDWKPTNTYRSQKFTVSRREGARIPNVILDERSLRIKGKVIGSTPDAARTTWDTFLNRLNHNRLNPASEHISKNLYLFEDRFLIGMLQKITPDFEGALGVINFDIDFVCANPFYHSTQKKRKTTTMSSSPQTFTVTPVGNAFTRPTIKVTAGGANITLVTVKNLTTSQSWSYSGTIASGESLILDTDELTLENDGANAFSAFSGESQLILMPVDNLFTVTFTGGSTNSVIRVDYYDRWF
jgi:hypothetical protein